MRQLRLNRLARFRRRRRMRLGGLANRGTPRDELEPVLGRAGVALAERSHAFGHDPIRRGRQRWIEGARDPHEKSREPAEDRAHHSHAARAR
ncbi:MAG TPA: hypothetical protein VKC17_04195 [Sphingomicrobium sp.]|nr:hypothetical protein [Sphingomicrobium sp.]